MQTNGGGKLEPNSASPTAYAIARALFIIGVASQLIIALAMLPERLQFLDVYGYISDQLPLDWGGAATKRFAQEMFAVCDASGEGAACRSQQWILFPYIPGTFPLYGIGAFAMTKLYGPLGYAQALTVVAVAATVGSIFIALAVMLRVGWRAGLGAGVLLAVAHLAMTFGFFNFETAITLEPPYGLEFLRFSKLIYLAPVLIVMLAAWRWRSALACAVSIPGLLLVASGGLLLLRGLGPWTVSLEIVAVAVTALAVVAAGDDRRPLLITLAGIVLLFLFCDAFVKNAPWVPRFQTQFVIATIFVAQMALPQSRIGWLLPIAAIFHAPSAGLIGVIILGMEVGTWLVIRRVSPLFVGAVICVALAVLQQVFGGLTNATALYDLMGQPDPSGPARMTRLLLSPRMALAVVFAVAAASVGLYILRRHPAWGEFGRLFLFYAAYAPIPHLQRVGALDVPLTADPRYYQLFNAQEYCGTAVQVAGAVSVLVLLFLRRDARFAAPRPDPAPPRDMMLASACLLALLSVKMATLAPEPRPPAWIAAQIRDLLSPLGGVSSSWMIYVQRIGEDGDRYVIDPDDITYPTSAMISMMKMRLRAMHGDLDAARMTFVHKPGSRILISP